VHVAGGAVVDDRDPCAHLAAEVVGGERQRRHREKDRNQQEDDLTEDDRRSGGALALQFACLQTHRAVTQPLPRTCRCAHRCRDAMQARSERRPGSAALSWLHKIAFLGDVAMQPRPPRAQLRVLTPRRGPNRRRGSDRSSPHSGPLRTRAPREDSSQPFEIRAVHGLDGMSPRGSDRQPSGTPAPERASTV